MMQSNIKYGKNKKKNDEAFDKSFNHLINPIEFQLMDQQEAKRFKLSKQKKKKDDDQNLKYIQV